jgi:hypothetical protein
MARTTQVHLVDDIDGSPADETVTFSLDGSEYEIELSAKHADQLRKSLARYSQAARRVARTRAVRSVARVANRSGGRSDRAQNQAVRAWARSAGVALSDRGRIPAGVLERYQNEAGQ